MPRAFCLFARLLFGLRRFGCGYVGLVLADLFVPCRGLFVPLANLVFLKAALIAGKRSVLARVNAFERARAPLQLLSFALIAAVQRVFFQAMALRHVEFRVFVERPQHAAQHRHLADQGEHGGCGACERPLFLALLRRMQRHALLPLLHFERLTLGRELRLALRLPRLELIGRALEVRRGLRVQRVVLALGRDPLAGFLDGRQILGIQRRQLRPDIFRPRPVDLPGKAMDVPGTINNNKAALIALCELITGSPQGIPERLRAVGLPEGGSDRRAALIRRQSAAVRLSPLGCADAFARAEPLAAAVAGKGTLRWLCEQYFRSAEFKGLEPRTQHVRRAIIDAACLRDGDKPYAMMEPRHVRRRRDEKSETPEAANSMVKALRQVFAFAVENDLAQRNPAKDVPYLKGGSEGFHSWTIDEALQFEERHAIGTKARLAFALLLYTGQRRSDVVTFGRQHIKDGWLTFTQVKNRKRKPISLSLPVRPELKAIIDATPSENLTFLVTAFGKPFTANGFGNWFRERCNEAKLPHCSAHGLRKAAAARLAELGAGESEIMAVTGHTTSKEVVRYTRGARQKVLAAKAMARFDENKD